MDTTRIVWTGPGAVELQAGTVAAPGPGEVLIENELTLISPGTEREWLRDDTSHAVLGVTFPFTPGYSSVGRIIEIGAGVDGWTLGDRVVPLGAPHGAHAAHQVLPAATLFKVPDGVSAARAVLYQLGGTAVHTIRLGQVQAGDSVGIIGQGPIGQIALQAVRALHRGSSTLVLDLEPSRLETARNLGADTALDPRAQTDLEEALAALGGGVRVVVDLSGAEAGINAAVGLAAPLGRVVLSTGTAADLPLAYGQVFTKGLTLVGAFVGARPMEFGVDTSTFLMLLAEGDISVDHLIAEPFNPQEAPEVYQRVLDGDRELVAPMFVWSTQ